MMENGLLHKKQGSIFHWFELLRNPILNLNPIHLLQHRFCGDHKEDDRAKAVDEIHGESGYVAGEDGLPFKCFAGHHHSGGRVHNSAIDNDCRECTEHGKDALVRRSHPFLNRTPARKPIIPMANICYGVCLNMQNKILIEYYSETRYLMHGLPPVS